MTALRPRAKLELDWFALDPYCKLYLPFWKLDGNSFMSKDAHGHLCTNHGSIWTPQGRKFDGVDDYVDIPYNFGQPNELSIELWFQTTEASWDTIFGQTNIQPPSAASAYISVFAIKDTGVLRAELWTGSRQEISTSFSVRDGNWHHAVMVGNVNIQSLYVDGQLIGSRNGTISQDWWLYSFIGTGFDDTGRGFPAQTWHYFNGLIDEVRIYNRALSEEEIRAHFLGARVPIVRQL